MKVGVNGLSRIGAALALLIVTGCSGGGQELVIPVDDARVLNSELRRAWQETIEMVGESQSGTASLATLPVGVSTRDFDVAMFRQISASCFTEPVRLIEDVDLSVLPMWAIALSGEEFSAPFAERPAVGRAVPCEPERMPVLEDYVKLVDLGVSEFLVNRWLLVDELRVNLNDVLVTRLDDLERRQMLAQTELVRLRNIAEERRVEAQLSDLSEVEGAQIETDYSAIVDELDAIEELLGQLSVQVGALRRERRSLVEQGVRNLALLGLEGAAELPE